MWNMGEGKGKQIVSNREGASHKRLLDTENKLKVYRGWGEKGKCVMGIEEGTHLEEQQVLYVCDESWKSTPKAKSTLYTLYIS